MNKILECVPNFSEGRNMNVIKQITDVIESVEGVNLIDVDPGKATNRTVVTFVGEPDAVCEAAFQAARKAKEVIDMRKHTGAHPRFGATDVCPLIPVAGISMEETVVYARKLAQRIGGELEYPVYCYEFAAVSPQRKNLADVRAGEYEGLPEKLINPGWKPDFGPDVFVPQTGATAVAARNFLVAYNVNLNTTSTRRANAVAFDIREKGRPLREGNPYTGKIKKDEKGNEIWQPGSLKSVKAIGWYIDEYGIAQISINLTDLDIAPLHIVFEEACSKAAERGLRVTGSELVGVAPLKVFIDAGKYFLRKQKRSLGISDREIIKIAVKSLGLDDLRPFDPDKKIIEYLITGRKAEKLVDKTLSGFVEETASESPAPGGGSIAACLGAFGAALATMVANLSSHKPGWDDRWEEFSNLAEKGKELHNSLMFLIDEDTRSFNAIMSAFALPKKTEDEKALRANRIQEATKYAIEVPFRVMQLCLEALELTEIIAETGNPNSVSDAGVGAVAARSGVIGAFLNVKINCKSLDDSGFINDIMSKGRVIENKAIEIEKRTLDIVEKTIGVTA